MRRTALVVTAACLSFAACYSQPAIAPGESVETSTGDIASSSDVETTIDESSSSSTSSADTQIDPDTSGSSTGPAECELGHFDQSSFDAACFAP